MSYSLFLLENSPESADAVSRLIGELKRDIHLRHFHSVNELKTQIKETTPDLIICSNTPPDFTWDDVFRIVQQSCSSVPFTLISTGMTIQEVTEAMVNGVSHVIPFSQLSRLQPIIKQEIEQKETEQELRKFSKATEQSPALIAITNTEGIIEYVNPKLAEVSGYTREELVGEDLSILKSGIQTEGFYKNLWEIIKGGEAFMRNFTNQKKDEEYYKVLQQIAPIYNNDGEITHFISVQDEITTTKEKEEQLQQLLKEKKVMLNEIHHRVNNNLAVISALMELQAMDEEDDRTKEKLMDNISRIQSMGTIHELLYHSESFSEMNFSKALEEIVQRVKLKYNSKVNIDIDYDTSPVKLNVNQALPTAFVVNEVVSNILKYAFDEIENPQISISAQIEADQFNLMITDNGEELPEGFDPKGNQESLGRQLINTLVDQLDGTYDYTKTDEGTIFELRFKKAVVKGVGNVNM